MAVYNFGFPDVLVGINFPKAGATNGSLPWFWWFTVQKPYYFQYIGSQAGGNGWQRTQNQPIIKILPIDPRPLVPTTTQGFSSLEDAIGRGIPDEGWGRFDFTDDFFWKVIGQVKPRFGYVRGVATASTAPGATPIGTLINKAVKMWNTDWNVTATNFNATAASGCPGGFYGFPSTAFAVPLPTSSSALDLLSQSGSFYLGPVPGGFWFLEGAVEIYKGAYSFAINIGQLDPKLWDMSVFPPQPVDFVTAEFASAKTKDYGGFGQTTFPLNNPPLFG